MYIASRNILFPPAGGGGITVYTGAGNVTTNVYTEGVNENRVSVTGPANIVANDFLYAAVAARSGTLSNSAGGFTKLDQISNDSWYSTIGFFYKIAAGTEAGATLTFNSTYATAYMSVIVGRISGANVSTPIDDYDKSQSSASTPTSYAEANTLTTTNAGSIVINLMCSGQTIGSSKVWSSIPATEIGHINGNDFAGGVCAQAVNYAAGPATPGTYTPPSFTFSVAAAWAAISVAIKP